MIFWDLRAHSVAAAASVAMLASAEVRAGASPIAVALEYSAVASCPEVNSFQAIVNERLGAEAFVENASTRVIVRITSRGQTFEGNMQWLDAKGNWAGERAFPAHSSDCSDLVRAMAFTLALQLQLSAVSSAPPSAATTVADDPPTTGTPSAVPPPPVRARPIADRRAPPSSGSEPPPSQPARPRFAVGAGTLFGFGMASRPVPFARIFGRVDWPYWSLELAAEVGLPTTTRRSDGAGFSSQEVLASVAGCGTLRMWSACLVAKAGEIRVSGMDIDVPASAAGPLLEMGFRAKATQRIYRTLYASAYGEGLVLPILWAVTLDRSVVWTSPRFAATIGFEVALRFE
jgi:hypothetical protein